MAFSRRARRLGVVGLMSSALAVAIAPAMVGAVATPTTVVASGSSCVNGVVPLNPYVVNCNLPPRGEQIVGAAPDAGAIIACRHVPTCIAYYVNYPGALVVPGYRP